MTPWMVDCDDFAEDNSSWDLILKLKKAVPNLKLNLFTIPGRCSNKFLREMRQIDWIRMYPHGCYHSTSRECQNWNYETSLSWLTNLEHTGWIKLWKSPGWMTSDPLFDALLERQWFVADQSYNDERRPKGLQTYILDSPNRIHGHIGHLGGGFNENALEVIFDQLVALEGDFMFIDDLMREDEIQKTKEQASSGTGS